MTTEELEKRRKENLEDIKTIYAVKCLPDDDVKIPNILWLLFAILFWLMAFVIGNETAESRKQIEMEKSLENNDAAIYSSNEYEK